MFYAHFVLSKKGPLARIWLAAHWDKKLTKAHVFETNIEGSVEAIIQPKMKLALRTSGHLLLGVVRIYSRKAKYLLADCNEAFVKIKMAFRPGAVDLPEENREAAMASITLPEDFHEFDTSMADLSDIDVHAQFAVNQSRPEEITMREDLGNITLVGDDGFGDMGFDGGSSMIQDAHLDDTLYKNADAAFLLGESGGFHDEDNQLNDKPMAVGFDGAQSTHNDDSFGSGDDYDGPAGADDDVESDGASFNGDVGNELFDENFSGEAGGLFEEPPSLAHPSVENVGQLDHVGSQNGGLASPVRTRSALNDVTLQQQNVPDQVNLSPVAFDQTAKYADETEAFALEPIDITAVGTEKKVRKKRRLIIDEQKSIASETMKIQLSDTSEIVTTLDLAPPTKKLMHWKETGGVEKLFAFPGRQIVSKRLSKLFTNNLVTRSAAAENNETNVETSYAVAEHGRGVPNNRTDVLDHPDIADMPDLPVATNEAYGMPASVAPCIVDELTSADTADSSRVSLLPVDNSLASVLHNFPSPGHQIPDHSESSPPHSSSEFMQTATFECTADSDYDNDDGGDMDDMSDPDPEPEPEPDDDITFEPVDESEVPEAGKEAEAEERRWNKRSQQMLFALNRCLQRHDSVSFRQMAPPSAAHSRKQAAAKFYTFLVLKKLEAIDVSQHMPYGDIMLSRGPKFELLS